MKEQRIAMFGGTFNPPHLGHVHAAQIIQSKLDAQVLFIPANIPPHKNLPKGSATPEQRYEMTCLAAQLVPGSAVLDMELRRENLSYTADTLEQLRCIYPEAALWLVVGTDMFTTLHQWYRPEQIIRLARIAVLSRFLEDAAPIAAQVQYLHKEYGAQIDVVEAQPIPVSSSQIRETLYQGGEKWLPECVFTYIREKGLYLDL